MEEQVRENVGQGNCKVPVQGTNLVDWKEVTASCPLLPCGSSNPSDLVREKQLWRDSAPFPLLFISIAFLYGCKVTG